MNRMSSLTLLAALTWPVWGTEGKQPDPPRPPQSAHPIFSKKLNLLNVPQPVGRLSVDDVPESSGLISSRNREGVLWTHNDSGGKPRIIAVDQRGTVLQSVILNDARNRDWEDLAFDEKGRIFIADIGNNLRKRKDLILYQIEEPKDKNEDSKKIQQSFPFRFPDKTGSLDAEALIVRDKRAYIFSKEPHQIRMFGLRVSKKFSGKEQEARLLSELKKVGPCTGADLTPDGRYLALLTYGAVIVFECSNTPSLEDEKFPLACAFKGPSRFRKIMLGQAEGIAFCGQNLLVTTESIQLIKRPGQIWKIEKVIPFKKLK